MTSKTTNIAKDILIILTQNIFKKDHLVVKDQLEL